MGEGTFAEQQRQEVAQRFTASAETNANGVAGVLAHESDEPRPVAVGSRWGAGGEQRQIDVSVMVGSEPEAPPVTVGSSQSWLGDELEDLPPNVSSFWYNTTWKHSSNKSLLYSSLRWRVKGDRTIYTRYRGQVIAGQFIPKSIQAE